VIGPLAADWEVQRGAANGPTPGRGWEPFAVVGPHVYYRRRFWGAQGWLLAAALAALVLGRWAAAAVLVWFVS
jgi:hypothetical protein